MRKTCIAGLLLLFAAVAPVGGSIAAVSVPTSMSDSDLQLWQKKITEYAQAGNRVVHVDRQMESYFRWAEDGPKADSKNINGVPDMTGSFKIILRAAEESGKTGLKIPELDDALNNLAEKTKAFQEIAEKARTYYSRKDYLTDNMAAGIAMHPQLEEAYDAFSEAGDQLKKLQEELTDKIEPVRLAVIEKKYGKEYYWHHMKIMGDARNVIKFLPDSDDESMQIDAAGYDGAVAAFGQALTEFEEYYTKVGDEKIGKMAMATMKPNNFNNFLASSRELSQELKAPKRDERKLENRINSLVNAYNNLINRSNSTRFKLKK